MTLSVWEGPGRFGNVSHLFPRPFIPSTAIGPVPSLSGHAITYPWRSSRIRGHRASSPQGSSSNGCCLCRYHPGPINLRLAFPTPTNGTVDMYVRCRYTVYRRQWSGLKKLQRSGGVNYKSWSWRNAAVVCMYVCMYVWSSHIAEYGSTG